MADSGSAHFLDLAMAGDAGGGRDEGSGPVRFLYSPDANFSDAYYYSSEFYTIQDRGRSRHMGKLTIVCGATSALLEYVRRSLHVQVSVSRLCPGLRHRTLSV